MRRSVVLMCVLALNACGKHAPKDEPPPPLDRSAIYPLVVRTNDLPTGPVRRPLVEGLVVALAADSHAAGQPAGQAKLLREVDLQGMTLDEAYTTALANLEGAARRGEITVRAERDASGHTIDVVWGHDWRAAACLLLPGVRAQAESQLVPLPNGSAQPASVYAAIPNRDVLVLFTDPVVAKAALAAEKGAPRPITDRMLRLVPEVSGTPPFWLRAPVSWAE